MKALFLIPIMFLSTLSYADVAGNVQVEQAFARAAIQQQRNSAAFMKITNSADTAAITYAKSPVADIVELHTHINDNGVMRMRKIKQIDLPASQMVELKSGGLHVMLLGLNRDLKEGEQIEVTLGFNDKSEKVLSVPVRMMKMRMKKDMHGHGMKSDKPKLMTH